MMHNRFLSRLLAVLMLLCLMMVSCAHAEEIVYGEGKLDLYIEGAFADPPMEYPALFSTVSIKDVIIDGLMNQDTEINIYKYQLTPDDLGVIFQDIVNNEPDLFFISGGYRYSQYEGDEYVLALVPTYLYTGAELDAQMAAYNSTVAAIAADARKADTTVGQLLRINEYFCLNYEYDTSLTIRKPNEFFKQGTGVCQAYMLAFKAVLDELGIESTYAVSDPMNHIWNMVNVGGEWYHVDVTWNDPTPDAKLFAHHDNLLLSDTRIKNNTPSHYSWVSNYEATSTKYDDMFWTGLGVPLNALGSKVYYTSINTNTFVATIHEYNLSSSADKAIYSFNINSYSSRGVPCWYNGSRVYFPKGEAVYSVDKDGEDYRIEYTLGDSSLKIRSIVIDGSTLYMSAYNGSSSSIYTAKISVPFTMSISPTEIAMKPGETKTVNILLTPEPEVMPPLTYTSSQPLIAAFDENGVVTAGVPGTATITVSYADNTPATATVTVHTENPAVLPENTVTIGAGAFANMPTVEFILPVGVETIGSGAFSGCDDLLYINLPESLTEIQADAFDEDSSVTLIVTDGTYAHEFAEGTGLNVAVLASEASVETETEAETETETGTETGTETAAE